MSFLFAATYFLLNSALVSRRLVCGVGLAVIIVACSIPDDDQYFAGSGSSLDAGADSESALDAPSDAADSGDSFVDCFACGQTSCPTESDACAADSGCQSCAVANPDDPNCQSNVAFIALILCGCSKCNACGAFCPAPDSCFGRCGCAAPKCFCDEYCGAAGDCCPDFTSTCSEPIPVIGCGWLSCGAVCTSDSGCPETEPQQGASCTAAMTCAYCQDTRARRWKCDGSWTLGCPAIDQCPMAC